MKRFTGWFLIVLLAVMPLFGTALAEPYLTSLLFETAEFIDGEVYDDGSYHDLYVVDSGMITLHVLGLVVDWKNGELPFETILQNQFGALSDPEYISCDPVGSYPAERIRFILGANEDTAVVDALCIRTDTHSFVFAMHIPADAYYGYMDGYENNKAQSLVEEWIASIDISDADENDECDSEVQGGKELFSYDNGFVDCVTLVTDLSCGNSDGANLELVSRYEMNTSEARSVELLTDGLSALTGLDFFVSSHTSESGLVVDWAADSTLIMGLDEREQNPEFFFFDADSLNWFMMDSLYATIAENMEVGDVYYTMNGGEELYLPELSIVQRFPIDLPYMGSPFYFAHSDLLDGEGRGDYLPDANDN